nr:hypothetical protein [uncultured Selenomonas sp.]
MGLFWGKKNEEASPALVVEETEPVEEPSRYDNLSHAEKEARMLDTIYEMAKTIECLNRKIEQLEDDIQQIKEDASEAHYWARQRH